MKQYCAPTEHDYQVHTEAGYTFYGGSYSRTFLYCTKCGHYRYVEKTPSQYAGGGNVTWSPPLTSYSVTFQLLNKTTHSP